MQFIVRRYSIVIVTLSISPTLWHTPTSEPTLPTPVDGCVSMHECASRECIYIYIHILVWPIADCWLRHSYAVCRLRRSRNKFEVGRNRRAFPFDLSIGEANSKQRFERASRNRSAQSLAAHIVVEHRQPRMLYQLRRDTRNRYAANTNRSLAFVCVHSSTHAREKSGMRRMLGIYRVTWFVCRLV